MITVKDLPSELNARSAGPDVERSWQRGALSEQVKAFKRGVVRDALAASDRHQSKAAEMLGIKQSNLSRLMKTLGLR